MRDMQQAFRELEAAVKKGRMNVAMEICLRLADDIKTELAKPTCVITPEKSRALQEVRKALVNLAGTLTKEGITPEKGKDLVLDAQGRFWEIFSNTVVYLLRHPETATEEGRAITTEGVKQARNYALALINELLLCPKEINVCMYTSETSRTKSFAKIVAAELKKLADLQGRKINFNIAGEEKLLSIYSRLTDEQLKFLDNRKGLPALLNWFNNFNELKKQFPGLTDPRAVVGDFHEFVEKKQKAHQSSEIAWNIVLGFSHGWVLDAFRVAYSGQNIRAMIPNVGFVKIDGDKVYIDTRWYPYS